MKVLKILAVVFGSLLLLTGAGLLFGSYAVGQGNNALQGQMSSSGLAGPVDGVVQSVDGRRVTVEYTDELGDDHTATGDAAMTSPAQPGDTVTVYYSPDAPEIVVITDITGDSLTSLAGGLRTAGIVSLVVGGLLLLAGILGLVLGKKTPALAAGPGQTFAPQPYPGQPYPGQQFPGQQFPGQQFPGQGLPGQGLSGQQYPAQPYPGEAQPYPPQGPPYPGEAQPHLGQPEAYGQHPGQPYPNPDRPAPDYSSQPQYPDPSPYAGPTFQPAPPQPAPPQADPPPSPAPSNPPSDPPPSDR